MDQRPPDPSKASSEAEPLGSKTVARLPNLAPQQPSLLGDTTPLFSEDSTPDAMAAADPSTFTPGQLVAGRYQIVRFLAQGGMGEVYEAEDQELKEPVALKIVRPEIAQDERMLERFIHEIRLARRVTHPNVCRIFDVFHHQTLSGEDVTFLTMELLGGETLSARLRRAGRMSPKEALPLVRQMGGALGAAHDVGVIHLDFKSQNVMLVPSEKGPRAIVMDFGLARATALDETDGGKNAARLFAGTPATMAPEQVEGAAITTAADIYAFGVVLYQMVTGHLPFSGSTPATVAVKRLKEPPPAPRTHIPDLDPEWESIILRCLERDPSRRFPNVAEILEALGANTNGSSGQRALAERMEKERAEARRRRRRLVLTALPALLLLAAGGINSFYTPSKLQGAAMQGIPSDASRKVRRSVAILGFKNLSGRDDTQWLSTALSEMFGIELAAGETLRVLPGEDVARMKLELALSETSGFSKDTLERVRKNLGTDLVILGSYLALEGGSSAKLRLDLLVQDATSGETIASLTEAGTVDQLHDLVARTGGRLRGALPVGELSAAAIEGVRASLPKNPEAARSYSEGLEKLRRFEALEARDLLASAVALDPGHALSHWALAEAWKRLGHDEKAAAEAQSAFELSQSLTREERLSIEGSYREDQREWDRAIEIYRSLLTFFPDNLDYGLRLAAAQVGADRAQEAQETIEKLRQLFPGAVEDPRLDVAEAQAAESLSDMSRQRAAAERAVRKGTERGVLLLVARAQLLAWQPLEFFGDAKAAKAACEEARRICGAARDQACVARSLEGLGALLAHEEGHVEEARQMLDEALSISREIGDQMGMSQTLRALGEARRDWGDTAGSTKAYSEALGISRSTGDRLGAAMASGQIASLLKRQGLLEQAKEMYEKALAEHRAIGYRRGIHQTLRGVAGVLALQGRLREAQAKLEELVAFSRQSGHVRETADTTSYLAGLLVDQGKLSEAREVYEEGLKLFSELGDQNGVGRMRCNLGAALCEMGMLAEAQRHCSEALDMFRRLNDRFRENWARWNLGRALLLQGQLAAATAAFEESRVSLRKLNDLEDLPIILSGLGDAAFLQGDLNSARTQHAQALALQEERGQLVPAAESRLALARVDLEEARLAQAAEGARKALEQFRQDGSADQQAMAQLVLARALLAQGSKDEARSSMESATALATASERLLVRLHVKITGARIRAASGPLQDAPADLVSLESALAEAAAAGFAAEMLEARLALGELELAAGKTSEGRARLEALRQEAEGRGFGLAARKAASLLR